MILPAHVMIIVTDGWLGNENIREAFASHPFGEAAYNHLKEVYAQLASQHQLRNDILAQIERLSEELTSFDGAFARKARSFHNHLDALEDGTDHPERASSYRELKARFFPHGLSIVQRTYLEKGGAIVEIEAGVTADIMRQLEGVRVGEHTLADLYRDWVAAGRGIGERVQERMRLQRSLSREGSLAEEDASSAVVRGRWIRAVRMLLSVAEVIQVPEEVRGEMLVPLEESIAKAQKRREGSPVEAPDAGEAGGGDADDKAADGAVELGEAAGASPAPAGEQAQSGAAPVAAEAAASAGEAAAAGEAPAVAASG